MRKITAVFIPLALALLVLMTGLTWAGTARWREEKANGWYAQQPWLIGSNYVPKSAINQLEMWQEGNPAVCH